MSVFDVAGLTESELSAWIAPLLGDDFGAVTTHVPRGFQSYVRVFHPADPGREESTTWSSIARQNGTVMHQMAQFDAIAPGNQTNEFGPAAPRTGDLAPTELHRLTATLRRHTPSPEDCVFAFWEGWGDLARPTRITTYQDGRPQVHMPEPLAPNARTPPPVGKLTLPHRQYALFRGDLDLAERFGNWANERWLIVRSPNLMWNTDRAWLVATEIDFDSTLVGGTSALITDIIDTEGLEAAEVQPTDLLHSEADTFNS
ncbi:hypothetical protein [uncultured Jatrophihabitans sp.]|uniref:hypothetical protein n=1 Tax=uncultured Jatrophihabitans sp. TaxID=1610747 RepID=UPI0035CB780C